MAVLRCAGDVGGSNLDFQSNENLIVRTQKQTQTEDKNKTRSGTVLDVGVGLGRWEGMDC